MVVVWLVNAAVVIVCVVIHYEFLFRLTRALPRLRLRHRYRIVLGVEVWIFAIIYYLMHHSPGWGEFGGNFHGTLMDCVYFSFTTYTTLGFGEIYPDGPLRHLTGIEALTGLVLITWSASFLYLEMQRYWDLR
jgi:hypothetical protein